MMLSLPQLTGRIRMGSLTRERPRPPAPTAPPPTSPEQLEAPNPPAFIAIWPRGFTKSTLIELGLVYLGTRGRPQYVSKPWTMEDGTQTTLGELEKDFVRWVREFFPDYVGRATHGYLTPFADFHLELIHWLERVPGERDYAVYVGDTQVQAEQHVENIGTMLESDRFSDAYPGMSQKQVGRYGNQRGWRRTRLWNRDGWTVDAAGLDRGMRGARRENLRPRVIAFDDLDRDTDSASVSQRKERSLTRAILPLQGPGCAFLGVQNLVVRTGIFTKLADGSADFLIRRRVSGPHAALRHFDPKRNIAPREDGGWNLVGDDLEPTWDAMPVQAAVGQPSVQGLLDTYGLESFLVEVMQRLNDAAELIYPAFNPAVHAYVYKGLPRFVAYYGGLDFGGEGETAHYSAVTVMGLTSSNRLVLVYEWYDRGQNVEEKQMLAIDEAHTVFGYNINWTMDGDERTYFQTLRRRAGMATLRMASRVPNSAKQRRRQFGFLLPVQGDGRPRFYYLERPMVVEGAMDKQPHTIGGCKRFRFEIEKWKRKPNVPGEPFSDDPIEVDDDVLVSVLYGTEGYTRAEDIPVGAQAVTVR